MRRTYISPEFIYTPVFGSFNMLEQSSFFGSKMLEIEDKFNITNDNLIYYQQSTGEQLDLESEISLPPVSFDQVVVKSTNHKLTLLEQQDDFQKNGNAIWEMTIDSRTIFLDSMFATLKKYRTFEGMQRKMTVNSDIRTAIYRYIDLNIRSRYRISRIEMFIDYIDLLSINGLKYGNIFDQTIESPNKKFTKFQTATEFDDSSVKLSFTQEKSASLFAFRYYFNIYFDKI